jgi:DNA helicase-2/ATP-dependent DNA helicase PcrA
VDFTQEQEAVIDKTSGYHLVLATAGSGKTASVTERISRLIKKGVSSHNILALTFTNKAAKEMRDRVTKKVGEHKCTISTFHSLAFKILIKNYKKAGYKKEFEIVTEKYLKTKIIELYKEDYALTKDSFKAIDGFIAQLSNVKKKYRPMSGEFSYEWEDIAKDLNNLLKHEGKATFDDLLYEACLLFEKDEEIREQYADWFRYIILDETQDTSPVQYRLVELMAKHKNIMVVGDVNQAINGFNGSSIENTFDFDRKYKPEVSYLSTNFRSTKSIVDVSNHVLTYSIFDEKMRKPAEAAGAIGNKPTFQMYEDVTDQANRIGNKIEKMVDSGLEYKDVAILYRNNVLSLDLEKALIARGIPYTVKGGNFINRKEVQVILACLQLSLDEYSNDKLACIVTICNCFNNKVSDTILHSVVAYDKERSFRDIVYSGEKIEGVGPVRMHSLKELCNFIDLTVGLVPNKTEDVMREDSLLPIVGKVKDLMSNITEDPDEMDMRKEALDIFNGLWNDYFKRKDNDKTLKGFVNNFMMELGAEKKEEKKEKEEDKNRVALSTIHSFKGLEAKVIFVTTVKDGVFPRNVTEVGDQEYTDDICLWYVALSRPETKLHISSLFNHHVWFYPSCTYSLMQMFLDTDLIDGLEEYRSTIERKTGFYEPYLERNEVEEESPF